MNELPPFSGDGLDQRENSLWLISQLIGSFVYPMLLQLCKQIGFLLIEFFFADDAHFLEGSKLLELLANEGINIQEIARRLGRSDIKMTWSTYSHLYPREEERAIIILDIIVYNNKTPRRYAGFSFGGEGGIRTPS